MEVIALNKCDALDAATVKRKVAALKKASRKDVHALSAVARTGVDVILRLMAGKIRR
jgi:GTPase involved in cell partitioning and DNA repair